MDRLTETFMSDGLPYKITVARAKAGGYVAEFRCRGMKWQASVAGGDPIEALASAKRWLKAPIYGKKG